MAVDSKHTNGTNGTNGTAPAVTAQGTGATPTIRPSDAALAARRKRSSSLMKNAAALPTVEHSLEEFIAKANQTLVDVSSWEEAKEQDAQRKEQDAQRWKNAEAQAKESEAREQSLRRQLDGLQGKLAEAEARAAVAGTQMGSAAHDTTISELKDQIEKAVARMRAAEDRSQELSSELYRAQEEVRMTKTSMPVVTAAAIDDEEAAERIRMAEAKAAKALAAAKAAQAGLTVSAADIAAIESGLVVVDAPKKSSPVLPIAIAFIGGLGIMFAVWKFVLSKDTAPAPAASVTPPPAAQPAPAQPPAPTPAPQAAQPAQPAQPVVTPIEEKAAAPEEAAAKPGPTVTPIEEPKAEVKEEPKAVEETPAAKTEPKAKAVVKVPPKAKAPPKKKGAIADPFAEPAKKKAPEKKPGGIVDPF